MKQFLADSATSGGMGGNLIWVSAAPRMAVFTLASRLRMLQGITTDSAELLALLSDKKGAAGPHQSPLLPSTAEKEANQHL
jgi:hypothetical protein